MGVRNNAIVAAVVLGGLSAMPTSATDWMVDKRASQQNDGSWVASCQALRGVHGLNFALGTNIFASVDNGTIATRTLRGDEDPFEPVVVLVARADQGTSRAIDSGQFGYSCTVVRGEDFRDIVDVSCEADPNEHRFSYQLDAETRKREAWGQQLSGRYLDEEGELDFEYGVVYWLDYPPEMFDTNEARSIRMNFSGLGAASQDDTRRPYLHHTSIRISYEYGLDTMNALSRCVSDHQKAGRWDGPPSQIAPEAAAMSILRQLR